MLKLYNMNEYFFEKSQRYLKISKLVNPSMLGNILKKPFTTSTFLPKIGLFATEFSIGYCCNLHKKKS
jgi:hypothetical protein